MRTHPVLTALAGSGVKLGLDAIGTFLAALGEPHLAAPVVHVAGTNGKGSVCTYVTQMLVEAGYHVGTNTSPHLEHVNERFAFDGQPIDDASLSEAIESLDRFRWAWARNQELSEPPLTYFEFCTALAFRLFAEREVDAAVIEVGLGGRLDATNVVEPVVTAITHVGLDHQDVLGDTIAQIASEKAGILKTGVPAVLGATHPEVVEAVTARAHAVGAPLWRAGVHLAREPRGDAWVFRTPDGVVGPVRLAMPGAHQGANALVAVGVAHQLRRAGFAIPDAAIEAGLAKAKVRGRLEALRPGLWIDGAHNVDGSEALGRFLAARPDARPRILLFGLGEGRDPRRILAPLLPHVDEVVLTRCAHPKAREPIDLAASLGEIGVLLSDGGPIDECLAEVFVEAQETVVAGSLYLAGAARSLVADGVLDGLVAGMGAATEDEPEPVTAVVVEEPEDDEDDGIARI